MESFGEQTGARLRRSGFCGRLAVQPGPTLEATDGGWWVTSCVSRGRGGGDSRPLASRLTEHPSVLDESISGEQRSVFLLTNRLAPSHHVLTVGTGAGAGDTLRLEHLHVPFGHERATVSTRWHTRNRRTPRKNDCRSLRPLALGHTPRTVRRNRRGLATLAADTAAVAVPRSCSKQAGSPPVCFPVGRDSTDRLSQVTRRRGHRRSQATRCRRARATGIARR